jgi:hypothetical protein
MWKMEERAGILKQVHSLVFGQKGDFNLNQLHQLNMPQLPY